MILREQITMTSEQNKDYILNNLDKYIIDDRGNFINLDKDYKDSDYIIFLNNVEDYEEVKEKVIKEIIRDKSKWKIISNKEIIEDIMEAILSEKENWEIVYKTLSIGGREPIKYKYLPTGEEVNASFIDIFNYNQTYILNGELGWREHIWEDYDQWGHYRAKEWQQKRNYKKQQKLNSTNPIPQPEPTQPQTEKQKNYEKSVEEAKTQAEREKYKNSTDNLSTQEPENQNNSSSTPESKDQTLNNLQNQETSNNPLPSPTEIQNNYNSDKSKSEIDSNPNLTNPEQKNQANKLLKIVISAELLIKKKQLNQEILSKLITEKKNNTSLYQLLNKESRIDKVISKLESIQQQSQKDNKKSLVKNKDNGQTPAGVVLGIGIFLAILGLGVMTALVKRKKVRRKIKH